MIKVGEDGAEVSVVTVMEVHCSRCGIIASTPGRFNERAVEDIQREHLHSKHGGVQTGLIIKERANG